MSRSAVVLFSGGQDSTTCLYWAKQQFSQVEAVGFDYGQRHRVELEQATKIAVLAQVPYKIFSLAGLLGGSALVDPGQSLAGSHPLDASLPASFVPGRNLLFLTIAAAYAYGREIDDLVIGAGEADYSGYPDCRRVFIEQAQTAISLAMAPREFRIHAPLMDKDKADIFRLAEELGILELVLEHTHTDYYGDRSQRHEWGYGKLDNEASRLRARGWEEFKHRYRSG